MRAKQAAVIMERMLGEEWGKDEEEREFAEESLFGSKIWPGSKGKEKEEKTGPGGEKGA